MRDELEELANRSERGDTALGMEFLQLAKKLKGSSVAASKESARRAIAFLEPYCDAWSDALPASRWDPSYEEELAEASAMLDGPDGDDSTRVPKVVEFVLMGQMQQATASCQARPRSVAARIAARIAAIWCRRTGRDDEATRIEELSNE